MQAVTLTRQAAEGARIQIPSRPAVTRAVPGQELACLMNGSVIYGDDAARAGRVRVRLPKCGDALTGWLREIGPVWASGGGIGLGWGHRPWVGA